MPGLHPSMAIAEFPHPVLSRRPMSEGEGATFGSRRGLPSPSL